MKDPEQKLPAILTPATSVDSLQSRKDLPLAPLFELCKIYWGKNA